MRINILVNAPWTNTAYGTMARQFAPRIKALGHEISMTAMWGLLGGMVSWEGMRVYPKGVEQLSGDVQGAHAQHFGADIFMSWCDAFVVNPDRLHSLPWSPWFPIDGEPAAPELVERVKNARWPLVYSRHGEAQAHKAGLEHVRYLPPGVETDVMRPMDRKKARERTHLPQDRYIVGMVQANIDKERKAQPQQILAFAEFKRRHPDALLYIHAFKQHALGGLDLVAVCEGAGLTPGEDVLFAPQYEYMAGHIDHSILAALYNSFDVLLACTRGEGFGIPIVEAASCGVPAIVGDWSSMSELDFAGLAVPADCSIKVWNNFDTWWRIPEPDAITDSLELAYRNSSTGCKCGKERAALRYKAMEYDIDKIVADYWQPLLAEMEAELCDEPERIAA